MPSDKPGFLRRLASHFREEVLEVADSAVSGKVEVWYANGKLELNSAKVNYSFGTLDTIFREAFAHERSRMPKQGRVLLLGVGAGNVPRILSEIGRYTITGVELDPEVIRLGRKYFGLGEMEGLEIVQADAIEFVSTTDQKWDMVIVDLFVDEQVPKAAEAEPFLRKLAGTLSEGGMLFYNRLMHTAALAEETERFTHRIQKILPETRYCKAHKNRMLLYEKG